MIKRGDINAISYKINDDEFEIHFSLEKKIKKHEEISQLGKLIEYLKAEGFIDNPEALIRLKKLTT